MKYYIFILSVLCCISTLHSQNKKIIIRKEVQSQTQIKPDVTISGYDGCRHKTNEIILDKHLRLNNNPNGLVIVSFMVTFIKNSTLTEFKCLSDSLSQEVLDHMKTLVYSNSPNFHIDYIKAVNSKKDTLLLHPIAFALTN